LPAVIADCEVTEPRIISKAPPEELVVSQDFIDAKEFIQSVKVYLAPTCLFGECADLPYNNTCKHMDLTRIWSFATKKIARCQERYVNVRPVYFCAGKVPAQRLDNRSGKMALL
jgi:hypothetical protein